MSIRYPLAAISAAMLISSSILAQDASSVALPFSRTGLNPVIEAMGGAGMLSTSACSEAGIAATAFSDIKFDASGEVAFPLSDGKPEYGAFAGGKIGSRIGLLATARFGSDDAYETFDASGNATGTFAPSRFAVSVGASARIVDWLSAGVNVRYAAERLYTDATTSAVSADAVLMGKWDGIKAAAGVVNLGSSIDDESGEEFPLATSIAAAIGYAKVFGKHGVESEVRMDYYLPDGLSCPVEISAGAAYTFNGIVSVRGGYHYAGLKAIVPSFASAGLGVKFHGIHLDAALRINEKSGNSICAGLGYRF